MGYGGNRGISVIAYDGSGAQLRRGAGGTAWDEAGKQLVFQNPTAPQVKEDDYDVAAADVFRFELAFLLGDGRIIPEVDRLFAVQGTPDADRVRAVIVGLASLDARIRERLTPEEMEELSNALGEAKDGQELLQSWNGELNQSSLPVQIKNSVRLYQRFFPIHGNNP